MGPFTWQRWLTLAGAWLALALAAQPQAFGCDVRFLGRAQADEIDKESRNIVMERAGKYQRAVVQEALNFVPPLLCAAVRRVVFVDKPGEVAIAYTNTESAINDGKPADLVYFNNAAMPESLLQPAMVNIDGQEEDAQAVNRISAIHAVIHESTHVADHLLDSQRVHRGLLGEDPVDAALWSPQARQLAAKAVAANLLKKGFRQEWIRLHDAFVQAGMARAYYGLKGGKDLKDVPKVGSEHDANGKPIPLKDRFGRPAVVRPAPLELAGAGFMTQYGGTKAAEDIAEMAAGALTRQFVIDKGVSRTQADMDAAIDDHACEALRELPGTSIPTSVAAMYTKLGFLQSVGLISDAAYTACVGKLKIAGGGEGFFSFKSDRLDRSYTGGVGGSIGRGEPDGPLLFELGADGAVTTNNGDVPVTITLILSVSPPPGLLQQLTGATGYGELEIEDVSFPRGIYYVGFRHGPDNKLQITRKDNGAKIMEVGQGVALVARASRGLIEGSVFVQRYFNYAGGALSAIAGDEPVGEPTKITFRRKP